MIYFFPADNGAYDVTSKDVINYFPVGRTVLTVAAGGKCKLVNATNDSLNKNYHATNEQTDLGMEPG